jgi:CRISPR-associated endonuclease/helicase Cas3
VETFAPTTSGIERNRGRLVEHIEQDWMIVPAHTPNEDEHETLDWKSRDIPAQRTVLTQRPEAFDSYADFRRFELECGVACVPWQIEVGMKKGRVAETTFWIGDEEETMLYAPVYSPTEGLILDQDRERSLDDRCL